METKVIKGNELSSYVEGVILKDYPVVEDRTELINYEYFPVIEIKIMHIANLTEIVFIKGTNTARMGDGTSTYVNHRVEFSEVEELIDFLLNDHRVIDGPYIKKENRDHVDYDRVEMHFNINWCNAAIPGIHCGTVILGICFSDKGKKQQFMESFSEKYVDYLANSRLADDLREAHLKEAKEEFFKGKSKEELIELLNKLDRNDLVEMLCDMSPEIYSKYFGKRQGASQKKRLIAKKSPENKG